jgi:hypothetical protein
MLLLTLLHELVCNMLGNEDQPAYTRNQASPIDPAEYIYYSFSLTRTDAAGFFYV